MLTARNYIEAAKRRKKEETGEEGFSLIELIIVVVILGILVAIAIPIFLNIQAQARQNSVATVAANGATQGAAQIAQGSPTGYKNLVTGDVQSVVDNNSTTIDGLCVTATLKTGEHASAGPGCNP